MTKYGVFIIESLRDGDYLDGKNLSKILALSKIEKTYHKVHSKQGFIESLRITRLAMFIFDKKLQN